MQKSCEEIAEILVDYAEGQLSPSASSEVAKHLAKCSSCRGTLEALQKSLCLADVIWKDGLVDITPVRIQISRKKRQLVWRRYAAIAASILLVLACSIVLRTWVGPTQKGPTLAEIERRISESGSAARLLAAADLLAEYPDAETIAKQQYRYIVERYPETAAAAKAKLRIR